MGKQDNPPENRMFYNSSILPRLFKNVFVFKDKRNKRQRALDTGS